MKLTAQEIALYAPHHERKEFTDGYTHQQQASTHLTNSNPDPGVKEAIQAWTYGTHCAISRQLAQAKREKTYDLGDEIPGPKTPDPTKEIDLDPGDLDQLADQLLFHAHHGPTAQTCKDTLTTAAAVISALAVEIDHDERQFTISL